MPPPDPAPATRRAQERSLAAAALAQVLQERFGPGPRARSFFAPGRVNLMGAHLDYNGGPVMPMPVDRGTLVAARATDTGRLRLASVREPGAFDGARVPAAARGAWYDYPLGVLRQLRTSWPEGVGVDLVFGGDLPIGAGLSSSASICVATALAAQALLEPSVDTGGEVAALRRVDLALEAERGYVGVRCGIMDPFAVGLGRGGHLLWLDCRDRSHEHVPLDATRYSVGVVDSGVRRELAAGEFNRRVAQCAELLGLLREEAPDARWLSEVDPRVFERRADELPAPLGARGRHVFGELARTRAARAALVERGDAAEFGRLMTESHASLREHYEVSIDELDRLVRAAVEVDGVLGSRLTGAGFGGCTVVLLERGAERDLEAAVARASRGWTGPDPRVEFFRGGDAPHELDPADPDR